MLTANASHCPCMQPLAAAGLGGMDPLQMTQLMGFLPAAVPFSLPSSEVAAALLGAGAHDADGAAVAEAAADAEEQQQEQQEAAGEGAAGQRAEQSGAAAHGLTPEQVAEPWRVLAAEHA